MTAVRKVSLHGITLPVRVSHGNLSASQRIDDLDVRIDTLQVGVEVVSESQGDVKPRSMLGAWNYGELYKHLCLSDVPTMTGPLEAVLDTAISQIDLSAKAQHISLIQTTATANRLGLAVGYPQLTACRRYQTLPGGHAGIERSAGICNFPLVIAVNHSWCEGSQRVEHIDVRTESVCLAFRAETRASTLSSADLTGLYNYAGLIHQVQKMQGLGISGPVEQLCDIVTHALEEDARSLGVELLKTEVEVRRTGYARCTPVLTLTKYFFEQR